MTRPDRLRQVLKERSLDALLITAEPDIFWASGFRSCDGVLLLTADEQLLVTDSRYFIQAANQAPEWELLKLERGVGMLPKAARMVKDLGLKRVGFQADCVTYAQWEKLTAELDRRDVLAPTQGLVSALREVKDEAEIAAMRQAAQLADETMQRGLMGVREGLTPRELKADLDFYMASRGAEGPSFPMIVCAGSESALPHAPLTDRPFQRGDLVTIDLGCVVDGYCSDLTRSAVIGPPTDKQQEVYQTVYRAQVTGLDAVGPGVTGREADAAARQVIDDAGYGEHFGHGLGHGVGIEIHENPRVASSGDQPLVPGNVVTVEPGIYLEGFGGVRIEDLVLVTDDGREVLSQVEKPAELMVL